MLHEKTKLIPEAGFGLVEVMIASGLLALVVGAVTVFMQQSSDNLVYRSAKVEQQRLYKDLREDIQSISKIRFSSTKGAIGNTLLDRCLRTNNAKAQDCTLTLPNKQVSFQLWTRQGLGDIQKTPMNYSLNGVRNCTAGTSHCPFWRAESYFWATCPGGAATCDRASNIHIRYIVRAVKDKFRGIPLVSIPPEKDFADNLEKYAISHNVTKGNMQIAADQNCPTGALMSGLEDNGKIKCECRGGFTQVGKTTPIVCQPLATLCKPGQRIKGRKKDGSALCVNQAPVCKTVNFSNDDGDKSDASATCPVGGWLENINLGYCRPGKKNKKGTKRGIKCDTNQGKCCYYEEQ